MAELRRLQSSHHRQIEDPRDRLPQHRRLRDGRRHGRAEPRRHGSTADGRYGAEAQGCHRRHQECALQWAGMGAVRAGGRSGHDRQHPRDGRLRQRARADDQGAVRAGVPARRHLHARLCRRQPRRVDRGQGQSGDFRGAEERDHLRPRARWRQLRVADRGAGLQGGLLSELPFKRPARDQHERRHERHDEHHEQVSRAGDGAEGCRRAVDMEPGERDQARTAGEPVGRGACRHRRAAPREGQVRLPRSARRAPRRHAKTRL